MLGVGGRASAEVDDGACRNGGFPAENAEFGQAVITGAGRAYLLYDMDGCPTASARCEKAGEGYVLPGDHVVTGRAKGDYICAYYPSHGGGSAGWVDKSRLRPLPIDENPPPAAWLGPWSDEGNPKLHIAATHGALHIAGKAYWPGPTPQKDWPSGWPHTGEIDGRLALLGRHAYYVEEDCKVDLTLAGDMLVASDNGNCGGMNVRFDGVYRRIRG